MKKWFVTLLAFCSLPAFGVDSETISEDKASDYLNQEVMLCGLVKQVTSIGESTYLNLGGIYPNQKIAFVIPVNELPLFASKFGELDVLQNKQACAKGIITENDGKLQIVVRDPQFLRFMK